MEQNLTDNFKALIVEDSNTQAAMLSGVLKDIGYTSEIRANGWLALELLNSMSKRDLPLVVISDIFMPEMNGYEFCRAVREKYNDMIFIMVTGYDDSEAILKSYKAGATDFITKPLYEQEIKARISNLIQKRDNEEKIRRLVCELKAKNELLEKMVLVDELTRVYNRRYIINQLAARIEESRRFGYPLSIILFDIDDFKKINDVFGYLSGDMALYIIAQDVKEQLRKYDSIGRYGGEEFVVLLPNTSKENAFIASERIRKSIKSLSFDFLDKTSKVTVSCGISCYEKDMTLHDMLAKADANLYMAKSKGKDRSEA